MTSQLFRRVLPGMLFLCTACGIKGPPLPPIIRVAERTRDLSIVQKEKRAILHWSYPQMTTAGSPLPDLEEIEVWRVAIPSGQEPSLASNTKDRKIRTNLISARGEIIRKLAGDEIDRATVGSDLEIEDDLSFALQDEEKSAPVLWYAVLSVCCSGRRSEFSNIARIQPTPPPEAPEDFSAEPQTGGILLSWAPPAPGGEIRIERSPDASIWTILEVPATPDHSWLDSGATQGRTWFYRARITTHEIAGTVHLGRTTEVLKVDYPDVYPPDPPAELLCLPEPGRIRLRWLASDEAAYYRVERETAAGRKKTLAKQLKGLSIVDRGAPAGRLLYRVWAVDEAGNLSEPAECRSVSEHSG